jgi:PKD repeat protein
MNKRVYRGVLALVVLALLALALGGCMSEPLEVSISAYSTNNGLAPSAYKFSATIVPCADTINWDFGDGGTSTEDSPTHVYQNAGSWTAKVMVTKNNVFCGTETASDSMVITVGEKPYVTISSIIVDPSPVCSNIPARVSAVVDHNYPITYAWSTSDGHTSSDASTTFTFGAPGKKTITLTVTDNTGAVVDKTTTLVVKNCCDPDPCPPPCPSPCPDPCKFVLNRLEPEEACILVYEELEITALFKSWPCVDPCEPCGVKYENGTQGITPCPCPPKPDCGCGGKKIAWDFAFKCCGGISPILNEDFEILEISGEFGQIIKVRFFRTGEWVVTASINGESVTGHYTVVVL